VEDLTGDEVDAYMDHMKKVDEAQRRVNAARKTRRR